MKIHTFATMIKKHYILLFWIILTGHFMMLSAANNQQQTPPEGQKLGVQIIGNDTLYLAFLKDVYVFPKMKFKNKKQEEFYWRTVRDVKRALPYAKIVSAELYRVNVLLEDIQTDKERKKYLSKYEKEVFKKYSPELSRLTINQGKLLLKLIDRETNSTSYDLIKQYRGNVAAFFWQGIARIFGSNLKSEFDAHGNDKIVERVIVLVESGQL